MQTELVNANAFDAMVYASMTSEHVSKWNAQFQEWLVNDSARPQNTPAWLRPGIPDLAPPRRPFGTNNVPISSHYWQTLEHQEALAHISLQDLWTYNAFKTSMQMSRANLQAGTPGSPGRNKTIMLTAMAATVGAQMQFPL